jgi:hypothetical protein
MKEKEDGENCINHSLISTPNVIAMIKSVPRDTKSGRTKIGRKRKFETYGKTVFGRRGNGLYSI